MRLLFGLLLLGGLGYGAVYVLSLQQPAVSSGLGKVEVTRQAAQSFDEKVRALEAAAAEARRTGKATPVEVTFSEQELTSKIAEASAGVLGGGLAATDTQIHLSGGDIVATSKVNVQGIDVNVGVIATPVVEGGRTKIVIKEIQTGGLPIPDALKREIQTRVGQAIDPESLGVPFEISKLQVVDGKIVVSGTARP